MSAAAWRCVVCGEEFGADELTPAGTLPVHGQHTASRCAGSLSSGRKVRPFRQVSKPLYYTVEGARAAGFRGDAEGWTTWAVFPAAVSDGEIECVFDLSAYDGGPGRSFSHGGHIRRTATRALAMRSGGLDV